jgi:hypothetical protein
MIVFTRTYFTLSPFRVLSCAAFGVSVAHASESQCTRFATSESQLDRACHAFLLRYIMSEEQDIDTALRIVVTPSQSSYFAGEPLSVTITITNTRSPQSQVAPPRSTHKRSAHSVSSARLARPPTSPGLPKTPLTALSRQVPPKSLALKRKRLIGTAATLGNVPHGERLLERRNSARSLSVDIPSQELPSSLSDEANTSLLRPTYPAGEHFSHYDSHPA